MLDPAQFRLAVIRPSLQRFAVASSIPAIYSPMAENLLLGTALQESGLVYLRQLGDRTGRGGHGLYQDEPEDLDDLKKNFLAFRPSLEAAVEGFRLGGDDVSQLEWDMTWASIICRLHYFRSPEAIPSTPEGQAAFYKSDYNTVLGAAEPDRVLANFRMAFATP